MQQHPNLETGTSIPKGNPDDSGGAVFQNKFCISTSFDATEIIPCGRTQTLMSVS